MHYRRRPQPADPVQTAAAAVVEQARLPQPSDAPAHGGLSALPVTTQHLGLDVAGPLRQQFIQVETVEQHAVVHAVAQGQQFRRIHGPRHATGG